MVNWKPKYLKYKLKFEKLNAKQKAGSLSHQVSSRKIRKF